MVYDPSDRSVWDETHAVPPNTVNFTYPVFKEGYYTFLMFTCETGMVQSRGYITLTSFGSLLPSSYYLSRTLSLSLACCYALTSLSYALYYCASSASDRLPLHRQLLMLPPLGLVAQGVNVAYLQEYAEVRGAGAEKGGGRTTDADPN